MDKGREVKKGNVFTGLKYIQMQVKEKVDKKL